MVLVNQNTVNLRLVNQNTVDLRLLNQNTVNLRLVNQNTVDLRLIDLRELERTQAAPPPGSLGELAAVRAGLRGGLRQARHQHLYLPPHRCTVCWSCAARCQCHGRERSVVPALAGRRSWSRSTLPPCRTSCTARPACCRRTPSPRCWPTSGYWQAAEALSSQESGVCLFRSASTPGHTVTAVMTGVDLSLHV